MSEVRFEKAIGDLYAWRASRDAVLETSTHSADLMSVVRAIDGALKSEVLELRARKAIASQVRTEAAELGLSLSETPTGQHLWDMDWWLTESTLRALHASLDGLAQLLNLQFSLRANADSGRLAQEVAVALQARSDLDSVRVTVTGLWTSWDCRNIRAFVNHVKHAGSPVRGMQANDDLVGFPRITSIHAFEYEDDSYGPWAPSDINAIIDGYRAGFIGVVNSAASVRGV